MSQFSRTDRLPSTVSPRRAVTPIPSPPQNSKKFSLRSIAVDGCVELQMNHSARARVMKPITTANTQKIRRPKWQGIIDADAITGYFHTFGIPKVLRRGCQRQPQIPRSAYPICDGAPRRSARDDNSSLWAISGSSAFRKVRSSGNEALIAENCAFLCGQPGNTGNCSNLGN
jgi:hypothetical protein